MTRELQQQKQEKIAIIILSAILALIIICNIIMAIINNRPIKDVIVQGDVLINAEMFDGNQKANLAFSQAEFVSENTFERLLILQNKEEDCYLRFWLVSKMGTSTNNMQLTDGIISITQEGETPVRSFDDGVTFVENERYLISNEDKIYYTTDNEGKRSVFQKNTTAKITLTFVVADLDESYYDKYFNFDIVVETISVDNLEAFSTWEKPTGWPEV